MCSIVADAVRTDLFKAGFVTNEDKSVWIPCQRLDWLGITWDSARGTIEIVDRRVAKITSTIDSIIDSDFVLSARRLASFTGQIISTAPVSGNISRIMTRHCIMSTLSAQHWDSKVKMIPYCIERSYIFGKTTYNGVPSSRLHGDRHGLICKPARILNGRKMDSVHWRISRKQPIEHDEKPL